MVILQNGHGHFDKSPWSFYLFQTKKLILNAVLHPFYKHLCYPQHLYPEQKTPTMRLNLHPMIRRQPASLPDSKLQTQNSKLKTQNSKLQAWESPQPTTTSP
jgi:hypothetical protein